MPRHLTFRQIAADMADRIRRGDYQAEDRLPSYTEGARLYNVSVSTIQRAYLLLEVSGLIRGEPGRGVYIDDAGVAA
jgi:DNA-binding GntR family transcriptional regulator